MKNKSEAPVKPQSSGTTTTQKLNGTTQAEIVIVKETQNSPLTHMPDHKYKCDKNSKNIS